MKKILFLTQLTRAVKLTIRAVGGYLNPAPPPPSELAAQSPRIGFHEKLFLS